MHPSPFAALSPRQIEVLSDLLHAGIAADPTLAVGEGLALITAVDAERRRRAPLTLDGSHTEAPSALAPAELAPSLALAAAGVRAEVTSTTKWAPVSVLLARALSLQEQSIYVTSVGGLSRNVAVRLVQSRRAREATVAALIWTPSTEPIAQAISAAARACVDLPRLTLVFATHADQFDLAAIVTPPSLPVPAALTLAYPTAALVPAVPQTS